MVFTCKDCTWTGTTLRQAVEHAFTPLHRVPGTGAVLAQVDARIGEIARRARNHHRVLQWFKRWRGQDYPLKVKGWPRG